MLIDFTAYSVKTPKRWDVVAFEPPQQTNEIWVLRVAALPGETVRFATNGITINNVPLAPPLHVSNVSYVSLDNSALRFSTRQVGDPYVVPPECFFLLGDNSTNANDSRMWGAVPRSNILGRIRGK